jgi:hypothetical protein
LRARLGRSTTARASVNRAIKDQSLSIVFDPRRFLISIRFSARHHANVRSLLDPVTASRSIALSLEIRWNIVQRSVFETKNNICKLQLPTQFPLTIQVIKITESRGLSSYVFRK